MSLPSTDRWDRETTLVVQLAACASLLSFLYYLRSADLLLYGDAVAHINISRRVFDSRTPGPLQLGTVWLPLPHLLMIPFLLADSAWRSGIGGSIPSLISYVLGAVGIFRLVRNGLSHAVKPAPAARAAAWFATVVYAANPNLLYLQTTAMTEPLYLALSIWTVAHFAEFVQETSSSNDNLRAAGRSLIKCGACLAAACLTRYDGWFLAVLTGLAAVLVLVRCKPTDRTLRRAFTIFILLAVAAPAFWLAYNAVVYRNPLEFANGPYSARAIEEKSSSPSHPGSHNLRVACDYFLKSAELNMTEAGWQRMWVVLPVAGTLMIFIFNFRLWPLLLLWIALPFYSLSIAYSGVPLYVPNWWPFSYYNVRYGVQLLPAFAVFTALAAYFLFDLARNRAGKAAVGLLAAALLVASYLMAWKDGPVSYREAGINSRPRIALETELASSLRMLPHNSTLLMYLGDHVGALQRAGFSLRKVINEGNHRSWMRPTDPEGLWEHALADPRQSVDYVVAFEGDPVAANVQKQGLDSMVVIHTDGQPTATIYWTHRSPR